MGLGGGLERKQSQLPENGGGGFGPEGQLSQEPTEPQNSFSKLKVFGPREKLSLRSQKLSFRGELGLRINQVTKARNPIDSSLKLGENLWV